MKKGRPENGNWTQRHQALDAKEDESLAKNSLELRLRGVAKKESEPAIDEVEGGSKQCWRSAWNRDLAAPRCIWDDTW